MSTTDADIDDALAALAARLDRDLDPAATERLVSTLLHRLEAAPAALTGATEVPAAVGGLVVSAPAVDAGHAADGLALPPASATTGKTRRWLAPAVAAALVVAVLGVAAGVATSHRSSHGAVTSSASRHPDPASTAGLIGVSWRLATVSHNGAAVPIPAGEGGYLYLPDAETYDANDGCNDSMGTARLTSTTMTLTTHLSSQAYCATGFSVTVSAVLRGTPSWHVSGDELTVDHPGAGTLTYQASTPPSTPAPASPS